MECPKEFDDIRPFYDSEFHDKMKVLVTEPGFEHAVRYVLRDINYELFCQELLTIDNKKRLSITGYALFPRRANSENHQRTYREQSRCSR